MAAAIFFAGALQKAILQPIQALTAVSKELGEGRLDQVVPVEFARCGVLGARRCVQQMATRLRSYRQVTSDGNPPGPPDDRDHSLRISRSDPGIFPGRPHHFRQPGRESTRARPPRQWRRASRFCACAGRAVIQGGADYLPESLEKAIVVRVNDREKFLLPRVIGMRDEGDRLFGAAVVLQEDDAASDCFDDEIQPRLDRQPRTENPITAVRMGFDLLLEERIGVLNVKRPIFSLAALARNPSACWER